MKKYGFTMVELIFVIVILGILAAVAVPKLNASRQDAEITKFAANLATIYKDVQTYYLANGTVMTDEARVPGETNYALVPKVTNVPLNRFNSYYWSLQINGADCLLLVLEKNNNTGEFVRIYRRGDSVNANPMCVKMLEVFAAKPELKSLLDGQSGTADETVSNLTEYDNDRSLFRPIVKYKDGVQFD